MLAFEFSRQVAHLLLAEAHAYVMHKPNVIRACSVEHSSIQALKPVPKVCGLTRRLR